MWVTQKEYIIIKEAWRPISQGPCGPECSSVSYTGFILRSIALPVLSHCQVILWPPVDWKLIWFLRRFLKNILAKVTAPKQTRQLGVGMGGDTKYIAKITGRTTDVSENNSFFVPPPRMSQAYLLLLLFQCSCVTQNMMVALSQNTPLQSHLTRERNTDQFNCVSVSVCWSNMSAL